MTRLPAGCRPLALLLACAVLAGCGGAPRRPEPATTGFPEGSADPARQRIVATAMQMVGVPYRYGGESPAGFDCSGLVQYAYRSAGFVVPRTSRDQYAASRAIPLSEASPGDLLFFRSEDYSHVAIYLGQGRFIHAPATSRNVSVATLNEVYYRQHFVRAGRLPVLAGE